MKKVLLIIIASLFSFSSANALEYTIGAGFNVGVFAAEGKEDNCNEDCSEIVTTKEYGAFQADYGSVFVEYDFGGFSLGFDLMPYSLESERAENERGAGDAGLAAGGQTDTGNNTVQVNIENFVTLYGLVPIGDTGGYVKAGISQADLITDEAMGATSTAYPDTELDGYQVTAGWAFDTGVGASIRAEVGYADYDDVVVTGTGCDGTCNTVTVSGLDGPIARLSIVKAF